MSKIYAKLIFWVYERESKIKLRLFYFPILLIIGFLLAKIEWNNVYMRIIHEDSFVENAQFAAYFCASIIAFFAGSGCLKKGRLLNGFGLLVFASLLMFVSMEEISWGQRIFSVSTPEWLRQRNIQEEINVHNLQSVQSGFHLCYILAGVLFSFGWIPVRYISSSKRLSRDIKNTILLFRPRWYLMFFFLPVAMIYAYFLVPAVQINYFVILDDQEPAELLLALGFLLFAAVIAANLKHGAELPAGEGPPNAHIADRPYARDTAIEAVLIGGLLLAGLGGIAWRYVQVWRDSGSLWRHTLTSIPYAAIDHNNLANALAAQGKKDEAMREYDLALKIKPDYADAHYNLAQALSGQGKLDSAILHYKLALKAQPEYFQAGNNLANALTAQGKYSEAVVQYGLALKTRPDLAEAHYNMANALVAQGELDLAILHYKLTLKERPDLIEAHNNLANILARQGRLEEAVPYYRAALKLNPGYERARRNLEIVLRRLKLNRP